MAARFSRSAAVVAVASSLLASTGAQSGPYTLTDSTTTMVYTVTADTGGDVPLASKHFQYPNLPYHADSGDGPRGTQQGYNICNSTTLGDKSWCQTAFVNSIDDFCVWGAPTTNQTVADEEEELVAYCTTATHGSRVLPPGALQGVQFIKTPDYVEVVGYIDQTKLNLQASDYGGEEDPHGADQRGNPLGALLYTTAFPNSKSANSQGVTQVVEWSYFVGSGIFCFKACDPDGPNAAKLCEHVYDRIGCTYNAPADYASINGTFTSCQGDDQLPVGRYVSDGVTHTYQQPPESLGPITTIPYTPSIPATSQCSTYTSSNLYTALAQYYSSVSPSSSAPTSAATAAAGSSSAGTGSAAGAAAAAATGKSASAASTSAKNTGAASKTTVGAAGLLLAAVAGAVAVLA